MQTSQNLSRTFESYVEFHCLAKSPQGLYDPINYIMGLAGKRIRPVLVLLGYQLYRDDIEKALPLAYAVELFHNFSLVHDDIMDAAPLRRGQPTVHKLYGQSSAILSGDAMLILVYRYLAQLETPSLKNILDCFNTTALEVCEGQQLDMEFESAVEISIEAYLNMIELKTAALLGGSLELGAILAGAPESDTKCLSLFGRNFGIAFQLQDDYLDTFGDAVLFGKKIGGDIAQNKKTYLYLKALQVADHSSRQTLQKYYALPHGHELEPEKIQQVTHIMKTLNVHDFTRALMDEYIQKAFLAMQMVNAQESRKVPITVLLEKLSVRQS